MPPSSPVNWGAFEHSAPELGRFGRGALARQPAYLATIDSWGRPRVHPVTPVVVEDRLFVFMEPTSPKGRDLRERGWFALHNGVPDTEGTGGEFAVVGRGTAIDDAVTWKAAAQGSPYEPAGRYVLFELFLELVTVTEYREDGPVRRRWRARERESGGDDHTQAGGRECT